MLTDAPLIKRLKFRLSETTLINSWFVRLLERFWDIVVSAHGIASTTRRKNLVLWSSSTIFLDSCGTKKLIYSKIFRSTLVSLYILQCVMSVLKLRLFMIPSLGFGWYVRHIDGVCAFWFQIVEFVARDCRKSIVAPRLSGRWHNSEIFAPHCDPIGRCIWCSHVRAYSQTFPPFHQIKSQENG